VGMTANLSLDFRKPSLPDRVYIIRVEVVRREDRKMWLVGSVRCLKPFTAIEMARRTVATVDGLSVEEENMADLVVEATALFVEPKFAGVCDPFRLFRYPTDPVL
jgi:hypothetical protein